MTDDDAYALLYEMRYQPHHKLAEAIRHALQAIEDRQQLVESCQHCTMNIPHAVDVALHHMRGEKCP